MYVLSLGVQRFLPALWDAMGDDFRPKNINLDEWGHTGRTQVGEPAAKGGGVEEGMGPAGRGRAGSTNRIRGQDHAVDPVL